MFLLTTAIAGDIIIIDMMDPKDGMVIDDSGAVYYSDPEEVAWIKKMEEAAKKADRIWKEDGGSEEDEE